MRLSVVPMPVLSGSEAEAIFQAAQRILASLSLRVEGNDEFYGLVRAAGCTVHGQRVGFPQKLIDDVLQRIARYRAEEAREGDSAPHLEPRITAIVSGQGHWYSDVETDRLRLATRDDLATLSHIVDALGENVARGHPTFIPQDVPLANADLHAYATMALNSRQPQRTSVYSRRTLEHFIAVSDVVYGSRERTIAEAPLNTTMWITTPFAICREDVEIALAARRLLRRPVTFGCMPVAGVSTPVTLAGCLAQTVAEGLMLDVLSLAFNGCLCASVPDPLVADMRTGNSCEAGPDNVLLKLGAAQLRGHIYGQGRTPFVSVSLTTMAKCPGAQAVMEKLGNGMAAVLSGSRSYFGVGTLASADIGSYVELMVDLEITSYLERLLRGIEVTPERIAEEVIKEVVPTGARYLEHPHTYAHYRDELWLPELADRRLPGAWCEDPTTMVDRARAKARILRVSAPNRCPLDNRQRDEIFRILAAADREVV